MAANSKIVHSIISNTMSSASFEGMEKSGSVSINSSRSINTNGSRKNFSGSKKAEESDSVEKSEFNQVNHDGLLFF